MEQLNLPNDPTNVMPIVNWNGHEYDFYFLRGDYRLQAKASFVLKAERTSLKPTLKLVFPEFNFGLGGRLNASATQFLYPGWSGSELNGAVYLRDLSDNSVRNLVPPVDHPKSFLAHPQFYGNEVIYYRDQSFWRIGLDGSNNVPLFALTNSSGNP